MTQSSQIPQKSWESRLALADESALDVPTHQEAAFNTREVEELCRADLNFLAATAMPTVFRYFFPELYLQIWRLLVSLIHKERDFSRIAVGLPRGFVKTTLAKLFLLYVILFTKRQFIMVCAHSAQKAVNIVADVIDFLDEPNIKRVFGDWKLGAEKDTQQLLKFGFRGRNIVIAAGTVATIRGLNIKHQRPDVMLFDDIQSREDAESEVVSTQLETDLLGTAMKAKSPHGCLFIFLANMYPTKFSLLRKLKNDPTWIKFIAGAIVEDGRGGYESIWEELQPLAQLLVEYQSDTAAGKPEIFHAEVLNDENASTNNYIQIDKIPHHTTPADNLHQGNFVIIDPATDKANADAVSLGYFELSDSIPIVREIVEGRLSPGETADAAIKICLTRQCRIIVVESNAYQYVLGWIINQRLQQMGIQGIQVVEIYSGHASKNSRILTMFKQLLKSEILIEDSCRAQVTAQIVSFNPLKTNNTDGILDLLCYAPRVVELYGAFITSGITLELQETLSIPIRDESYTSPF